MPRKVKIKTDKGSFIAELYDNPMGDDIWNALPLEGNVKTWGDEIYFSTSLKSGYEDFKKSVVEIGELAFWDPGNAFCIFFGPTPGSSVPKPANPATVFGEVENINKNIGKLKSVTGGSNIKITKIK